jgi:hypothetical protein
MPASGEQLKHGVVAFEFGRDLLALKAVRYHFAAKGDFPFPLRGAVNHCDLKHEGTILFHPPNMRPGAPVCQSLTAAGIG